ncbi:uncharacterized protein VTP21DRAFT_2964 [Calcarisporiella thermophila]|uniref:uncharacterized protein n=1 Tax=Calcarisporiella thermophila TaxID=911321 RepID=UPI003741EF69
MLLQLLPEEHLADITSTYAPPSPEEVIQLNARHENREWKNCLQKTAGINIHRIQSVINNDFGFYYSSHHEQRLRRIQTEVNNAIKPVGTSASAVFTSSIAGNLSPLRAVYK